jgi:hypothetical protein
MPNQNPYASPAAYLEPELPDVPRLAFHRVVLRWLLVCGVSAAPSFYFGLIFGTDVTRISAMLVGILLYVLVYVWAEISWVRPRLSRHPQLRQTLRIGYISRVAISIFFPVAFMVDMPCGMISTGLVRLIPTLDMPMAYDARTAGDFLAFLAILLTTITQGALLHVLLFGYMGIVHTIRMFAGSRKPVGPR